MENPNLCSELITEILSRLPVKPLLRFKCVSKSWLALISSSEFVKTHLNLSSSNKESTHHRLLLTKNGSVSLPPFHASPDNTNNSLDPKVCSLNCFFNDTVTEAFELDYPIDKYPLEDVWVMNSVNGLICLEISTASDDFFLWNPSLRKLQKLAAFKAAKESGYGYHLKYGFGYDHLKYGFGYDESRDDYKIVGILDVYLSYTLHHTEVNIYSLKSGSWRSMDNFPGAVIFDNIGKFVNGKLHWINSAKRVLDIVFIDLADEKWGKMEMPYCGDNNRNLLLYVLRNDLYVFYDNPRDRSDVWVMKEYGVKESWTKLYTIKYPQEVLNQMSFPSYFMSNKGEIGVNVGLAFMIYSPEDDSLRYPKEVINFDGYGHANVYVESLVWPFSVEAPEDETQTI